MSRAVDLPVRNIMTSSVVTLRKEQSLDLAAELMQLKKVRHLPVVDDRDTLVGLVTHRDLLRAQAGLIARGRGAANPIRDDGDPGFLIPVSRIMRTDLWTVDVASSALEAARIMRDHCFGCVPVTQGARLVGILTEADFLDYVISSLEQANAA